MAFHCCFNVLSFDFWWVSTQEGNYHHCEQIPGGGLSSGRIKIINAPLEVRRGRDLLLLFLPEVNSNCSRDRLARAKLHPQVDAVQREWLASSDWL